MKLNQTDHLPTQEQRRDAVSFGRLLACDVSEDGQAMSVAISYAVVAVRDRGADAQTEIINTVVETWRHCRAWLDRVKEIEA